MAEDDHTDEVWADFVISAAGPLCVPHFPKIPGRESFPGISFHSTDWPAAPLPSEATEKDEKDGDVSTEHDWEGNDEAEAGEEVYVAGDNRIGNYPTLDFVPLRRKRVAVIGSAASAIQLLPEIATRAEEVFLFQRTPNWIIGKVQFRFSERRKAMFQKYPLLLRAYRWFLYWNQEIVYWMIFRKNSWISWIAEKLTIRDMRRILRDKPEYVDRLRPAYPMGCKRILTSNHFYQTLAKPNVHLVSSALTEIQGSTLFTGDGQEIPGIDVLIYATGFDPFAVADFATVQGREGMNLSALRDDPRSFLGTAVPKLPNFFLLLGPNSGLGHNTVVWMMECQLEYIFGLWGRMAETGKKVIEVKESALDAYYERLSAQMQKMVWSGNCQSWYKTGNDDDGEEEGIRNGKKSNKRTSVFAIWPFSTVWWWWSTRR